MDEKSTQPRGTTPWDILPIGARVLVGGRRGRVVARRYWFATVRYDGETEDQWHSVPIGRCVELHADSEVGHAAPQSVRR